jgi:BirA family biotin operon repressor/biotin-[acetyl-CoA-carboxylase] ligase
MGPWVAFDEVGSTQDIAEAFVRGEAEGPLPGVIFAKNQTKGRGRYERAWFSEPSESLTMSLVLPGYANHPYPWLLGMAVAVAVAGIVHCQVQWPNDLVIERRKVGGILTSYVESKELGNIPIVGLGLNLNQSEFPTEISSFATSVFLEHGHLTDAEQLAKQIIDRLASIPEPTDWTDIAAVWALFDDTPGKRYKLQNGETAVAIAVGPDGQLLCAVDGETQTVMVGDAIFGAMPPRLAPKKL